MTENKKEWLLLRLFLSSFAVLFVVGLASGASERNDLAQAEMIKTLRLIEANSRIYLGSRCHNSFRVVFDPMTRAIDKNPAAKMSTALGTTLSIRTHKDVILAFVGGSTGALTLQKISQASSGAKRTSGPRTVEKVLATVLGAASGYLLGYWLGTYSTGTCGSAAVTSALTDPEQWESAGRAFFWIQANEFGYVDERFATASSEHAYFAAESLSACGDESVRALEVAIARVAQSQLPKVDDYKALLRFQRTKDAIAAVANSPRFKACGQASEEGCALSEMCALVRSTEERLAQ